MSRQRMMRDSVDVHRVGEIDRERDRERERERERQRGQIWRADRTRENEPTKVAIFLHPPSSRPNQ
jgi:hypothetical protein